MESTALSSPPQPAKATSDGSKMSQSFTIAPSPTATANQFAQQVVAAQRMQYDALLTCLEVGAEWGLTAHIRRDGNGRLTVIIDGWVLEGLQ